MVNLKDTSATSVNNYFTALLNLGYTDNRILFSMVTLLAINDIIYKFPMYIKQDDLRALSNAFMCISGNCYIPNELMCTRDSLFHRLQRDLEIRITDLTSTSRYANQNSLIRIAD